MRQKCTVPAEIDVLLISMQVAGNVSGRLVDGELIPIELSRKPGQGFETMMETKLLVSFDFMQSALDFVKHVIELPVHRV